MVRHVCSCFKPTKSKSHSFNDAQGEAMFLLKNEVVKENVSQYLSGVVKRSSHCGRDRSAPTTRRGALKFKFSSLEM